MPTPYLDKGKSTRLILGKPVTNIIPKSGGGVLPEKFGGGVRSASQTLPLFKTKICDFPYPNYDLTKSRLECKNHTLFETKMAELHNRFLTKTAKKTIPFGAAHTSDKVHMRELITSPQYPTLFESQPFLSSYLFSNTIMAESQTW